MKGMLSTQEFLTLIGQRLRNSLTTRDFVVLSHLYADVAGIKKERQKRKTRKNAPPKTEPTMNDVILQLEKESQSGQ